jgi:RNA polymerase sigma-70 factor (ECF subfamily)
VNEGVQPLAGSGRGPSPSPARAGTGARDDERSLVAALRRGDEAAFSRVVERYHASMIRVARLHVESAAAAEEVAQEAWLGVLQGLDRFTGAATLKAWIFAIVSNCARTRGARDKRTVPLSALVSDEEDAAAVDPERFRGGDHPRYPGHWAEPPEPWAEDALVSRETLAILSAAIDALPPMQRAVITMRDVESLAADETCQLLGLSEGNQRVLLHRARSRVRATIEEYLRGSDGS